MKEPISDNAIGQTFRKYFSPEAIAKKSGLMVLRFPISVALLAAWAGMLFFYQEGGLLDAATAVRIDIFLAIGAAISIAATLWLEDVVNYKKQLLITGAATLLWGVYCIFLPADESGIAKGKILELWAIGAFSVSAILFICFLQRDRDKAFWNFFWKTLVQFSIAAAFGVIIFIGLLFACWAMESLFDYEFYNNIMIHLTAFCFVLFSSFYFLANIPDKAAKYDDDIRQDKTSAILGLCILTPLAAIYAVILYAYLFKIIIAWELPQGLVSWLVSALACCGLMIITLLYPARQLGKNKAVNFLSRWLGVIILPLIVLMSIGIIRRLSDYGITVARMYLLLANLWFYGIYAYIFITKARRVKWILISAAAIFLLTSIGPWSIHNVTKHILTAEIKKALDGGKILGPVKVIDRYAYTRTLNNENSETKIRSKIFYLYTAYGEKSVEQFFNHNAETADKDSVPAEILEEPRKFFKYNGLEINHIYYTNNFNSFINVEYMRKDKDVDVSIHKDQIIITVIPDRREFNVPIRNIAMKLIEMHKGDPNNRVERDIQEIKEHIYQGYDYFVIITKIVGSYNETNNGIIVNYFCAYLFFDR